MVSYGEVPWATHTSQNEQTAGFDEGPYVADRTPERFVVCYGALDAIARKDDVEGFLVFLWEHSGFQDIAVNHLADRGSGPLQYFQRPLLGVAVNRNKDALRKLHVGRGLTGFNLNTDKVRRVRAQRRLVMLEHKH